MNADGPIDDPASPGPPRRKAWKMRKGDRRHTTPSDLRARAARAMRPPATPNHAVVVLPGSTPRLGPPLRRRKGGDL